MIEVFATLQNSAQKSRYYSSELLKFQHEMCILGSQGLKFFVHFAHRFFSPLQKKSCRQP